MEQHRSLEGRIALVTGAGPNIGRGIAVALARAGATVLCNDVRPEAAAETVRTVRELGGLAEPLPGDVVSEDDVERMFEVATGRVGIVDALVNNAAVPSTTGILDTKLDVWHRVLEVAMTGTFLMSRGMARRCVDAGREGAIVNIGSTSGHRGRKNAVAYCSAKAGVLNLTRAMAIDLAPHGIRVNSVSPTKTGGSLAEGDDKDTRDFAEIPLKRLGRPKDQAAAVCFLLSPEAAFITGEDLRVDGGSLATWGTRSYPGAAAAAGGA